MALLPILATNPDEIYALDVRQIVALCGNGRLTDGSECSSELRSFLRRAPSDHLFHYVETCLDEGFEKSGQVLQDIVNELGRRLDFDVRNGSYSGRQNAIGFDGIWTAPDARALVVEVKTTDAYRINLDTLASYRTRLIAADQLHGASSILIIVGRQDTGDLEAQVRGSRHAWDIRLISAASMTQLVKIKESAEEGTVAKIRELLVPFEYTRVDRIIDLAFTAVTEISEAIEKEEGQIVLQEITDEEASAEIKSGQDRTPREILEALRERIIAAVGKREKTPLIRKSRALYWSTDSDAELRLACTISKKYDRSDDYWYAYHLDWDTFLSGARKGFYVLGCVDQNVAYALPHRWIHSHLEELHASKGRDNPYWHIVLVRDGQEWALRGYRSGRNYPLSEFAVGLGSD